MGKQSNDKKFLKGLFKDTAPLDQPAGTWRYAKNMILNDTAGAVSNEGGNELSGYLGDPVVDSFYRTIGDPDAKLVGKVQVDNDKVVLFSINVTQFNSGQAHFSEIGIWVNGKYSVLFRPNINNFPTHLLNFNTNYPIEGTFKIDSKGDLVVYWTDDTNPPRAFNVSRQERWLTNNVTTVDPYEWLYGIDPSTSHLDHLNLLNLFPNSGPIPHIFLHDIYWADPTFQKSVTTGGGLLTGVYHLGLAYVDDDQVATNYLSISNPVSIVDEYDHTVPTNKKDGAKAGSQTSKAIKWKVTNLNTDYKYMRPVIIRKMGEATEAFKLNTIEINLDKHGDQEITFSGLEGFTPSSVEDVIIDTTSYETAKTINQLDGVLYLGNLTGSKDLGYQKYANNIKLSAKTKIFYNFDTFYATIDNLQTGFGQSEVNVFNGEYRKVDASQSYRYIPNIYSWKGYQRDEIYAFYIAFILKDGSVSYAYHIPGRAPNLNRQEIDGNAALSTYNGKKIYEHSSLGDDGNGSADNLITNSADLLSGNNTRVYEDLHNLSAAYSRNFHFFDTSGESGSRDMNYWENATEYYPNTDNYDIWDETGKIGSLRNDGIYNTTDINVRHHHFPSNANKDFTTVMIPDGADQSGDNCQVEPTDISSLQTGSVTPGWNVTFFAFVESAIDLGPWSDYKRKIVTGTGGNTSGGIISPAGYHWNYGCELGTGASDEFYYDGSQVYAPEYGYKPSCSSGTNYDWISVNDPIVAASEVNIFASGTVNFNNTLIQKILKPSDNGWYSLQFKDSTPYDQNYSASNTVYDVSKELPTNNTLALGCPTYDKNDNTFVTHPHATQLSAFNALWDGNSGVFTADQDMTVKAWISMWFSSEQQTFTTSNRVAILARVKRADPSSYSTGVSPTGWPTIAGSGASVNVSGGVSQGAHGGHFLVDSGDSFLNYGGGSSNVSGGNYTIGSRFCTCSDYRNSSTGQESPRSKFWNNIDMGDGEEFEFNLNKDDEIHFGFIVYNESGDLDPDEEINFMPASGCMDFDSAFGSSGEIINNSVSGWHKNNVSHSQIKFEVVSDAQDIEPYHFNDVKVEHQVQALGFTLDDIKIPKSIADKVQGFRIYYAKRDHANKSILGQAPSLPMMPDETIIGMCKEAHNASDDQNSAEIMTALSDERISILRKDPYATWSSSYPVYDSIYNGVDTVTSDNGYKSFHFPDFYLLRTKNSLASVTHIKPVYMVDNFVWNGPSITQDKKMITQIQMDNSATPPIKRLVQNWGYDTEYNCWSKNIRSAFFIGCHYNRMQTYHTQGMYYEKAPFGLPKVIGQKAVSYLKGDSIFNAEALGFGGTVVNEVGESTIIYSLKDRHEKEALGQSPSSGCGSFSIYGGLQTAVGWDDRPFLLVGDPLTQLSGSSNGTPVTGCNRRALLHIDNLCAFKTDVYKSIDDQELVWTGFEVVGNDLNNFVFWDEEALNALPGNSASNYSLGQPVEITYQINDGSGGLVDTTQSADYSIYTLQSEIQRTNSGNAYNPEWQQFHIFGGDTFICRYGFGTGITYSDQDSNSQPRRGGYYQIVESSDNINFRHIEDIKSTYFPATSGRELLLLTGKHDLTEKDNIKYNSNYSTVNDVRPAFPLPLLQDDQDDFPTRTHRSVKADTTSLIDNYRIFKANQFKDLPKNRGDLWKLSSFNNLLYFHMQESLYAAKGKQSLQMKDGSESFVGSGDIFQQDPDEVIQTKGGFGGTQSQWAALTTRAGYFFVDSNSRKVFLMKDKLNEISKLGMQNWFEDNMKFDLEDYGYTGCSIDNPIQGMGFHSVYDPMHKRILLTKRDIAPTEYFITGFNLPIEQVALDPICQSTTPSGKIRFNDNSCQYQIWGQKKTQVPGTPKCTWKPLPLRCTNSKYFTCSGWTISFYTELNIWGSFHDYIPYLYFNTSTDFYSVTDQYNRVTYCTNVMTLNNYDTFCSIFDPTDLNSYAGTTYGNSGIWKHNSSTNHGILYQENVANQYTNDDWLVSVNHFLFEYEYIHNEVKVTDSLLSSFSYTLETLNQAGISVLEHGFTSFFVYNTFQISGDKRSERLEYLVNTRRIGNSWKVNAFRDLAAIQDQTGNLDLPNTNNYYMSTTPNVIGGTNTGTITTSSINPMFIISGMNEDVNADYMDFDKRWPNRRKFIDKWVGIRLIYDNISNNLLNLYSTNVVIRKLYR